MSQIQGEKATFGAGCFWGVEHIFAAEHGVLDAVSGYCGGQLQNPTYHDVCSGTTGHAEVVEVTFDPTVTTFGDLLKVFWELHDPTQVNRQGPDFGTQYRSAIFCHSESQFDEAEKSKLWAQQFFNKPIATEIAEASTFYPAEDYHQDYFVKNPSRHVCHVRRKLGGY